MPKHDLLDLIKSGQLPEGTHLHHNARRYRDRRVTGTVVADGIELNSRVYSTPSGAARSVTGGPVDGWAFWRLPDGRYLDSLRPGRRRLV